MRVFAVDGFQNAIGMGAGLKKGGGQGVGIDPLVPLQLGNQLGAQFANAVIFTFTADLLLAAMGTMLGHSLVADPSQIGRARAAKLTRQIVKSP